MSLLRKKTIEQSIADTDEPEYQLKKRLTALDLTVFGIGVIIGAGIFTLTGRAAKSFAGPGIALSFVLAAICCGLAALCYAEFSSTVPVSGSAYTFSYFSLGEIFAWIIGWDLLLELMLGASVVAQGWSTYAALFLEQIGLSWPESIGPDSHVNVLAMLLVLVLATLATIGIKESLRVNLVLVAIKLFVVLFVIVAGLFYIKGSNLTPFIPPSVPAPGGDVTFTTPLFQALLGFTPSTYGLMGLVSAASLVFFAFIGFDVVATTAEEARNPQRDLPRGILGSLAICTVLYVLVCIVITGMVKYTDISGEAALAEAFRSVGRPGFATLISAGAVAGLTTVVLTLMIGAARVVFAMSRDHLVPAKLGKTHPKFG
ncbi:MAG: basic amino acid/polyamine antiporter, family, partial [Kribbellaceae bacterium]|nr:basic amino acid/polyamine antiporter, family [Kribbellaceae bacterium]